MACVLCTSEDDPTDEDVIPKWLLRAFNVERGSTTFSVAEEAGDPREVGKLRHFALVGWHAWHSYRRVDTAANDS
jgi:hypothetical protein